MPSSVAIAVNMPARSKRTGKEQGPGFREVTGTEKQGRASVQVARDVSDRADDGGRSDTSRPCLVQIAYNSAVFRQVSENPPGALQHPRRLTGAAIPF